MFENLRQLYAMAVCFVAIMIIMIMSGLIINSLTEVVFTEYKHLERISNFESNENYRTYKKLTNTPEEIAKLDKMPEQAIRDMRQKERINYINSMKNSAKESIFDRAGWIIISLFFLVIHWKIYTRTPK
jgi:hypothetical protein